MSSQRGRHGRSGRDRELHKFPNGERCDECRARRWYSESGFRYCENGHRVEGYIERDIDEEENFGNTGKVSRKEKEAKEKVVRHLTGNAARELFLECLQLILRKQVWWLIKEKNLPDELETVVRDLWDLRVRNFSGLKLAGEADVESGTEYTTDNELFSSQSESERSRTSASTMQSTASRARSWTSQPGEHWNLPALVDNLAICYLGCILLRLPIRVGDIYNWAKDDQMLFLGAVQSLPREMKMRLPGSYHRALMARNFRFRGGEVHEAIFELVRSYHLNYEMTFPPLNVPLLLLQYLRELALPAEVYLQVRQLASLLDLDFSFDLTKQRSSGLDDPDITLVSCIILTTKILYPFDDVKRYPISHNDPTCLKMDWQRWQTAMKESPIDRLERRDMDRLGPEDAWAMDENKLDDYMNWFQKTSLRDTEDGEDFTLFPLSERASGSQILHETDTAIDERMMKIQEYLMVIRPRPSDEVKRAGDDHEIYRTVEDLPDTAKSFYEKAGQISGLSTDRLVKSVFKLERLIEKWIVQERKASASVVMD